MNSSNSCLCEGSDPDNARRHPALATLFRAYTGFVIATICGVPLGLLVGGSRWGANLWITLDAFRSMPATALLPAFVLFFGIGDSSKIAVASFVSTWAIAVFTAHGVVAEGENRRFLLRLHKVGLWREFIDGLLFPCLPSIAGGMRAALSLTLVVTIAAEMIVGTKTGLGQDIFTAQMTYRIPEMYAAIAMSSLLGIVSNFAFSAAARKFVFWENV